MLYNGTMVDCYMQLFVFFNYRETMGWGGYDTSLGDANNTNFTLYHRPHFHSRVLLPIVGYYQAAHYTSVLQSFHQ